MNNIKHFKLDQCKSTQEYLHTHLQRSNFTLCSTIKQTQGRGRGQHSWEQFPGSLAFSFTLSPAPILTLTSLEIAVLLAQFIADNYQQAIFLKWPNDLLINSGEKFGGILLQNSKLITVGVGLNWSSQNSSYPSLFPHQTLSNQDYHEIPLKIVEYIYNHRLDAANIIKNWNKLCFHLNKNVKITETNNSYIGKFLGIGTLGQAILKQKEELQLFNGSLSILEN